MIRKKTIWQRFGIPICLVVVVVLCGAGYFLVLKPKIDSVNSPVNTEAVQDSTKVK